MSGRDQDRRVRQWLRMLGLPPWRRALLRGWRSPSLFLGIVVAAFVLGLAGGSRSMFASSTARASLSRDVEAGCRFDVGFRVERPVWLDATGRGDQPEIAGRPGSDGLPRLSDATAALDEENGSVAGIDPVVVSVFYADPAELAAGDASADVQLIERTDFRDHIVVQDTGPASGAWVPDTVADELGVTAGDEVTVKAAGASVPVPVAGVYRDMRFGRDRHWCSMRYSFETRTAGGSPPPPVVLFDEGALAHVLDGAGIVTARAWWEYPPNPDAWDLDTARTATAELQSTADEVNNRSEGLGQLLGYGDSSVDVPRSVHKAERTAASVESVAGPVALGTVGVAVVMLLAAARSWLTRHAQEVTVLALRGAGPVALALKGMAELLPALLIGAVSGLGAAVAVVRIIGPDPRIEHDALVEGVVVVGLAVLVALGAVAAVVAAGVRRSGVVVDTAATARRSVPPWEPVVLAIAGAAFYELNTRERLVDDTRVDGLLLLFPLLLLAGGAGLAARLLLARRPLGWLAGHVPPAAWLAARRLSAARLRASLIVTGVAISIGIVVFASAMSSSVSATAYAKATLGPGSAQVVRLSITQPPLDAAPLPGISTLVTRTSESDVVRRGHDQADVLGVDPATFADGAYWDESFAGRSLSGLLGELDGPVDDGDGPVPAIGVGDGLPDRFVLSLPGQDGPVELEVQLRARAEAFPSMGYVSDKPVVVVDRQALTRLGVVKHAEVWVDDPSPAIADRLADDGLGIVFSVRPGADVEGTLLQPQVWAIDYLEVIGLAAGLVSVAGLGLYFAANAERRQLGSVVARRLGMSVRQGAIATILEVAAILSMGVVLGVGLAFLAARLVFRNLDPLPNASPEALLRFDGTVVLACGAAAAVTALIVTAVVERRAARASLPELLRDVG